MCVPHMLSYLGLCSDGLHCFYIVGGQKVSSSSIASVLLCKCLWERNQTETDLSIILIPRTLAFSGSLPSSRKEEYLGIFSRTYFGHPKEVRVVTNRATSSPISCS